MPKVIAKDSSKLPLYTRLWNGFKQYPPGLHQGAKEPPTTSGPAAAALISGGIGAVAMMATHHFAELSQANNQLVIRLGSWIPFAMNPDPLWGNLENYAGKELMFFVSWLLSWMILHPLLKQQSLKVRTLFSWMFGLFTLATVMAWHPLFPYLSLM
jgi:hypothetical protein